MDPIESADKESDSRVFVGSLVGVAAWPSRGVRSAGFAVDGDSVRFGAVTVRFR